MAIKGGIDKIILESVRESRKLGRDVYDLYPFISDIKCCILGSLFFFKKLHKDIKYHRNWKGIYCNIEDIPLDYLEIPRQILSINKKDIGNLHTGLMFDGDLDFLEDEKLLKEYKHSPYELLGMRVKIELMQENLVILDQVP